MGGRVLTVCVGVLLSSALWAQSRAEHRLRWESVRGAIGYRLQVRNPAGQVVLDLRTQATALEFSVDDRPHFFRLGAQNKFGETGSWTPWSPLPGGRIVEDPRVVAERQRKVEAARERSSKAVAEKKTEREKVVVAIREDIRKRVEESTGEFTLSGDAVLRGTIIETTEKSLLIRGDHGVLEVRRADISEARVYTDGAETVVPVTNLRGVTDGAPQKREPRLTSSTKADGRVDVVDGRLVLETRVGRIPVRTDDLDYGPEAPGVPPGPELKGGEYGLFRLRGDSELIGVLVLRNEHVVIVRTQYGQIELSTDQVLYTRPVSSPAPGVLARLRNWLGL